MAYKPRKNGTIQKGQSPAPTTAVTLKKESFASEGVTDNDVFLLPMSDYQIMGLLTLLAAVVRLFRIYQPTSVVFDEVQ